MKLTKKQRDEVVMLLRCAADVSLMGGDYGAITIACARLGHEDALWSAAISARSHFHSDDKHADLLEAALLVEEGVLL